MTQETTFTNKKKSNRLSIWKDFGSTLSWFIALIISAIVFYLVLTPIRLISKLFGKQFIMLKWDEEKASYWNKRSPSV